MIIHRQQRTLSKPTVVEGFGYWTGQDVRVEFRPAPPDSGIAFVRCDLNPPRKIPASAARSVESQRRTTLVADGGRVEMVEHLLAACAGLGIDNCEVWVDQPEMPGVDGSCLPFVNVLQDAGTLEQPATRAALVVSDPIRVEDKEAWIEARATQNGRLCVEYLLQHKHPIGKQQFYCELCPESFATELAPARTFLLAEEADILKRQGLGNRVGYGDLLVFDQDGLIGNELRFPNECARHKAMDLVGDLSLTGCDILGHIVASRSGHRLNVQLAGKLLDECELVGGRRRIA